MKKNRSNTVCPSDSIQQERLPVSLEVGGIYFWSLDLSTQRRSLWKKQTIAMRILPNISLNKENQAIKFGELIEYNMRNILLENHTQNVVEKLF